MYIWLKVAIVFKKIGSIGTMNGQFIDPSGIYIDQDQFILVGDSKNHRLQLISFVSES